MRLIDADALIAETMKNRCADCDRRKGIKQGKTTFVYDFGEVPCRACDVRDMIDTLDKATTIGCWISVKVRLPEKQTPVLVYVPPYSDKNEEYAEYVGIAYYMYSAIGGYWAGTDGNVYGEIGIIHDPIYWMPLPEPPKEDKDDEL